MCDTGKLYRDASVLALRKKQVDRLQREQETLEVENERLREHIRLQAADIITLGQMVGRNCPLCQKKE